MTSHDNFSVTSNAKDDDDIADHDLDEDDDYNFFDDNDDATVINAKKRVVSNELDKKAGKRFASDNIDGGFNERPDNDDNDNTETKVGEESSINSRRGKRY